jgi:propanol-preferring alcohol dehydrogenase
MKTLELLGAEAVRWIDVPEPPVGPGEVLVRIARSALCGSELHVYHAQGVPGGNWGHEAAGTVERLGPGVTGLQVGQRVGLSSVVGCGRCAYCAKGQYTWCQQRVGGYGAFHAEKVLMPARNLLALPEDIDWETGVLISGDGMGVPYHTSRRLLNPAIETVAIFGVGPIGLGNTIMQVYQGRRVLAVDVSPQRLELAAKLGAAETIDAREGDPVARIRQLTGGHGADVCIEAAGRPETLSQCFQAVRVAGTVAINGEQPRVELSPSDDLIRRDITALGSWFYHYSEFPAMVELVRQGLPASDLITHTYAYGQADEAWRAFAAGLTGKVILVYPD